MVEDIPWIFVQVERQLDQHAELSFQHALLAHLAPHGRGGRVGGWVAGGGGGEAEEGMGGWMDGRGAAEGMGDWAGAWLGLLVGVCCG